MADIPGVPAPLLHLFFFSLLASSSSPRFASDLEQARPQTTGEEELQLQLALAMSREEAEKVGRCGGAALYPGLWPLWRRGGLGLPDACALTRNCIGLLALCPPPSHSSVEAAPWMRHRHVRFSWTLGWRGGPSSFTKPG